MAGFFSPATLEQVRAASDIVDVIGSYVPLKRAGANFMAVCPFHKEKTPSFNVNPHRQIFHCFGCHKGGDVFTFVKEYENIPFPDAVRRLAERAKIVLEVDSSPGQQQTRHVKDILLLIHEQITQRWQNALATQASGQAARDYLAGRGLSEDAVKLFRLGYAPDDWHDTVNWGRSKGHEPELLEQAGLVIKKEGGGFYDRFRGRLMFPICDEQGRVIGFSGRVLEKDAKTAKYVNSPETPIFTKGKVFFGLDKSKRALLDAECAIVCEGQIDLISCFMAGVQNIVAPQGTALTADHARILKRYVDEVVLCFDSDNAGQNATVRSLDSLLASGLAVRVAVVPAPHDPDSFIKANGGEAFKKLVEAAEGFFDYHLNRLCATNDLATDKGRLTVLESIAEAVLKTGNVVLIDKYAQKTALRLGVAPEAVRAEFKKASRKKAPYSTEPQESEAEAQQDDAAETETRPNPHEFLLLKILLLDEMSTGFVRSHLDCEWLTHGTVRQIATQIISLHDRGEWPGIAGFLTACESAAASRLITEATAEEKEIKNSQQQLSDVVLWLRNKAIELQLGGLKQKVAQPDLAGEERIEVLNKLNELSRLRREPLSPLPGKAEEPF